VLAAMKAHTGHPGVQESAIMALGNLGRSDTTVQKLIKDEGGVVMVQAAVATTGSTVDCKEKGLRLLSRLKTRLCVPRTQVFTGMRFYTKELVTDDASEVLDSLTEHGGRIVQNVDEATHLLADTLTKEVQDLSPDLSRRTTHWVKECCKCRTTVWPAQEIDWRGWQFQPVPGPQPGIPCGDQKPAVITLTGYTGFQRDALKTLINMTGAEFTPALTKSNTHILCKEPNSKKAIAATYWGVHVVNHLWIMDSVLTWEWQPADQYARPGENILKNGEWTCLSQAALDSASMKHPRDLVETNRPLAEEDESLQL